MQMIREWERDSPDDMVSPRVSRTRLEQSATNDGLLIPVHKLKALFRSAGIFQTFRRDHLTEIPAWAWVHVVQQNARLGRYVNRYVGAYANRRTLKMKSALGGSPSDVSSDESVLSIDSSNDTCDRTNVNLPKPVCLGIRRVCRYYDDARRYREFDDDDSEGSRYRLDLKYH